MLRNFFGIPILCLALAIELGIAVYLVGGESAIVSRITEFATPPVLLGIHLIASLIAAVCISVLLTKLVPGRRMGLIFMLFLLSVFIPFFGAAGAWLSMTFGAIMAHHRHHVNEFWQFTNNADLPFAAPIDRPHPKLDSRGFIEQLAFDGDTETLYNKVVASRHIRDSQSGPILKSAVGHSNERIRLVAYQMLDKKVNRLNKEIQRLEKEAHNSAGQAKANLHLQIANNYWELLTLEGDEPVAREQLLKSAADHTTRSIVIQANNVNAHFLHGQISLQQGDLKTATHAFEEAGRLGMSRDKVVPYLAEAAFIARDFQKVRSVLKNLNPAFKSYPPLSHVSEFWA